MQYVEHLKEELNVVYIFSYIIKSKETRFVAQIHLNVHQEARLYIHLKIAAITYTALFCLGDF